MTQLAIDNLHSNCKKVHIFHDNKLSFELIEALCKGDTSVISNDYLYEEENRTYIDFGGKQELYESYIHGDLNDDVMEKIQPAFDINYGYTKDDLFVILDNNQIQSVHSDYFENKELGWDCCVQVLTPPGKLFIAQKILNQEWTNLKLIHLYPEQIPQENVRSSRLFGSFFFNKEEIDVENETDCDNDKDDNDKEENVGVEEEIDCDINNEENDEQKRIEESQPLGRPNRIYGRRSYETRKRQLHGENSNQPLKKRQLNGDNKYEVTKTSH